MDTVDEIMVSGLRETSAPCGMARLHTVLKIKELNSLLPDVHPLFDSISSSFERSINAERTRNLSEAIRQSIVEKTPTKAFRATIIVNGHNKENNISNNYSELSFNKRSVILIEGFHLISAICELLGKVNPFTNKVKNSSTLAPTYTNALLEMEIQLSVCFSQKGYFDDDLISKLFVDTNSLDESVYTQAISISRTPDSPLLLGAEELKFNLNLDALGGVSNSSKITKSDSYITTQNTLIYIILGSLGGRNLRIEKQLPKRLSDGTEISEELIAKVIPQITNFMEGWLNGLGKTFKEHSNGFHRSMQLWQALGLVIFHARTHLDYSLADYYEAGLALAKLDYRKEAAHWANCQAFKKDSTNTYWINATGGGRTFRDKIADYLISLLK
ncbi:hypothetical protein THOD04_80032 [Vibrio owensii]|uniref:hypothetical protein n=1 Tax=Vibrio owensii TaxID=696485 RepID=UPI00289523DE|nr:hypothetical protein THOD04_80032 [Vibrio owensii]